MNLVGKIFVVLILVASTVFMTMGLMVYATHQNWYELVMGKNGQGTDPKSYRGELAAAYAEQAKLRGEIEKLTNLNAAFKAEHIQNVAKLESERDLLTSRENALTSQVAAAVAKSAQEAQALDASQKNLTSLRMENEGLRKDIRDANMKTDEQLKKATEKEDQLNIANGQLADLKKRNEQLAADFAKANVLLRGMGMSYLDPPNKEPPLVRGQILAIDKEDRVEISLGSDDGLREGHNLEIYRGNKYLGRMQVLEVQAHRSVGMILKDYKREVIRSGDEVATRLRA